MKDRLYFRKANILACRKPGCLGPHQKFNFILINRKKSGSLCLKLLLYLYRESMGVSGEGPVL